MKDNHPITAEGFKVESLSILPNGDYSGIIDKPNAKYTCTWNKCGFPVNIENYQVSTDIYKDVLLNFKEPNPKKISLNLIYECLFDNEENNFERFIKVLTLDHERQNKFYKALEIYVQSHIIKATEEINFRNDFLRNSLLKEEDRRLGLEKQIEHITQQLEGKNKEIAKTNFKYKNMGDGLEAYATNARVIALHLKEFINEDLSYPEAIGEASRRAAKRIEDLQAELDKKTLEWQQARSLAEMLGYKNTNLETELQKRPKYISDEDIYEEAKIFSEDGTEPDSEIRAAQFLGATFGALWHRSEMWKTEPEINPTNQ